MGPKFLAAALPVMLLVPAADGQQTDTTTQTGAGAQVYATASNLYLLEWDCRPESEPEQFHGAAGRWWPITGRVHKRDDGRTHWSEPPRFRVTADLLTIEADGSVKSFNSRWSYGLPGDGRVDSRTLANFNQGNVEGLVKLLPAPPALRKRSGEHWLIASFATDVTIYLYVFDAFTGLYATYVKHIGPAMALIDTTTFHDHRCGGQ